MTRPFRDGEKYGAGVVVLRGSSIVLQQRSATETEPLTWVTFGGMGEPGETPLRTARRELREEAGLSLGLTDLTLIDILEYPAEDFRFWVFAAEYPDGQEIVLSDESHDHGVFPLGDAADKLWDALPRPLHSGMAELIVKPHVAEMVLELVEANAA